MSGIEVVGARRGEHRRRRSVAEQVKPGHLDTVAVIPARNEEAGVLASLNSLARQTRRPDLVLVVVNNSTDRTEDYAREFADDPQTPYTVVLCLPDNPHKKAGALNYGINWLREEARGRLSDTVRHVLVMDADTELHPKFIERACNVLEHDPKIGGVSASCLGQTGLWRNT
ncbi:glycosyltransferase family 2 protein [Streptomyces sp. SID3343]|uniref:glycosyltransferase n=1 Tax=Streptomyces sp. SID3343 TaxID=2690260 RepID=UPI00136FA1C3|nr:glycosyltransferase [Streptomyces sp. SID3343]